MGTNFVKRLGYQLIFKPVPIYVLIVFRILFALVTLISTVRFLSLGWVQGQYISPSFHFSYQYFEWVQPLPGQAMYIPFLLMIVSSIGMLLGWYYRASAATFFLMFTYVELLDKTYYLNHYYFVSLVSFWMIWLPANRMLSVDSRSSKIQNIYIAAWQINIIKFHLILVYFFAGIAKINSDWLLHALPLAIWLPANSHMPLIGWAFDYKITAYLFSWLGMIFDISISYFLINKNTTVWAWCIVVLFHSITGYLFQIGVFPLVMSLSTLIFFGNTFHQKIVHFIEKFIVPNNKPIYINAIAPTTSMLTTCILTLYTIIHLFLPFRYMLYAKNLFWTEAGYRFSWRVMLVEKAGTATFYISDPKTGIKGEVVNSEFLNKHQEKQMAFQPDMLLQYAKYLFKVYQKRGIENPVVTCEAYVTMNGSPSKLIIPDNINLASIDDVYAHVTDW